MTRKERRVGGERRGGGAGSWRRIEGIIRRVK